MPDTSEELIGEGGKDSFKSSVGLVGRMFTAEPKTWLSTILVGEQ